MIGVQSIGMNTKQWEEVRERLNRWLSYFVLEKAEPTKQYDIPLEQIAREAKVTEGQVRHIVSCVQPKTLKEFGLLIKLRSENHVVSFAAGRHPIGGKALVALHDQHGPILTYQSDNHIKDWISDNMGDPSPLRTDLFAVQNVPEFTGMFIVRIRSTPKDVSLYSWSPVTCEEWNTYLQKGEYPWTEYGDVEPLT